MSTCQKVTILGYARQAYSRDETHGNYLAKSTQAIRDQPLPVRERPRTLYQTSLQAENCISAAALQRDNCLTSNRRHANQDRCTVV